MEYRLLKLRQLIIDWTNYFRIANMVRLVKSLDEWIRRRIRMCFWKQWKKIKTKYYNLKNLELRKRKHGNTLILGKAIGGFSIVQF